MMLADIEKLLREEIGLHAETVGGSVVNYALKQRMAACRLTEPADYWRLVTSSHQELQELINAVVVPETWFFRDREAFAALTGHALGRRPAGLPVRMLSMPCSTGEEPYSMAMAMFDAGFAGPDFTIDAIDVSSRNIAEAAKAIYGRNSFRGADLGFRTRYFEPVEGGYRPSAAVLKQVRFLVGNLLDPGATAGADSYDVVFCRNLLIYFDRELQYRALERLWLLLVPDGLLLVGPAESSLPSLRGFVSARMPMAFAFFKKQPLPIRTDAETATKPAQKARAARPASKLPTPAPPRPAVPVRRPVQLAPPALPPADPARDSFAAIERAANAGRLAETKQAARVHIETFGPSADVFYLLGLAHDADDATSEAIENYRKALYLAPGHRETLAHLALLLERRGDKAGAKVLISRLGRIEKGSDFG